MSVSECWQSQVTVPLAVEVGDHRLLGVRNTQSSHPHHRITQLSVMFLPQSCVNTVYGIQCFLTPHREICTPPRP